MAAAIDVKSFSRLFRFVSKSRLLYNSNTYSDRLLHHRFIATTAVLGIRNTAGSSQSDKTTVGNAGAQKVETVSKAMKAYLQSAKAHDDTMQQEVAEYELGKRHLANIMGVDADMFTQEEIDKAIEYLLPSGLYDRRARPQMKHPSQVLAKVKAAQFGLDGRPFHFMFYTGLPNYNNVLFEASIRRDRLNEHEDRQKLKGLAPGPTDMLSNVGFNWRSKHNLEEKLGESIHSSQYRQFMKLLRRLVAHPFSSLEKEFIDQYRIDVGTDSLFDDAPELKYDINNRPYADAEGSRKSSKALVRVWGKGSGKVLVNNNQDMIDYFPNIPEREQVMFPMQFTRMLGELDVEAQVAEGGTMAQAGALRLAISKALQSFVDKDMRIRMREAGLLTRDPRNRERKKPGQHRARKKFTWKKR